MQLLLALILIWPLALQAAEWTSRPLQELAVFAEFRAPAAVVAADEARLAAEVGARMDAIVKDFPFDTVNGAISKLLA